jgi:Trypsin
MEEKKKSKPKSKQPQSSPPLTVDQMLRLENVVKHKTPPKELQSLKSSNSFAFPTAASDLKLERIIHKIDRGEGIAAWNISEQKVIRGLPIREFVRLRRDGGAVESPTLPLPPPEPPEWADLIYHPTMSPGLVRPMMRRINGRRVRPLYLFTGNRQAILPTGYPLQCIGKIFAWTDPYSFVPSWRATGVLVSRNTVLTASHAVPWNANPAMIQFIPAYFNGSSTLGPNVYSYVDAASTYLEEGEDIPRPALDFAVLRLSDPLGDSLGWFGTRTYSDGWNDSNYWTLVGYAGDIAGGEQPSSQGGISFHDDDEDDDAMELETDNGDATPGDSGGPFFAFWDDGPYIVGVLSGQEEEFFYQDNNVAAAGAAMVNLVRWAQNNWA